MESCHESAHDFDPSLVKDHNPLQAICRTNRTDGREKTHGLILDYIGIFDDVAQPLDFDERTVQQLFDKADEYIRQSY